MKRLAVIYKAYKALVLRGPFSQIRGQYLPQANTRVVCIGNQAYPDFKRITLIDLGEIVISHPFFSLLNCLQQLEKRHGLTVVDEPYVQIKGACLKNYIHLASEDDNLFIAFAFLKI